MAYERISVVALSAAPVKGLRIGARSSLRLERDGIAGDRAFYLVDDRGRLFNGKRAAGLQTVSADYDEHEQRLTLHFPDGASLGAAVELGAALDTSFYSARRRARLVEGPLASALSQCLGANLRLVAPADGSSAADRGSDGVVSIISRGSLARLAEVAGAGGVDARRFRMSVEVDGPAAHGEDTWVGRRLELGEATVRIAGHVGRCIVTTRDPDSDEVDLPTLDLLRSYRSGAATTEPLAFGVYGAVLEPGTVRIGDEISLATG